MYCDELSLSLPSAVQTLQGARKYQLNGLAQRCQEFVEKNLTDDDVCDVLEQSVSIRDQPLIDVCLHHIEEHTPAVFQSPKFLEVSPDVLEHILRLETLDVSELDLFHACVAWANHRARATSRKKINVEGPDLRHHLELMVPLIRFPTMTTSEFASFVVPLSILSDTETCNVYKYFTCPERPEKWFQTTKRKRPGDRRSRVDNVYPTLGHVDDSGTKLDSVKAMPTAPDLLSGSTSDFDRPPKYEEATCSQSNDA